LENAWQHSTPSPSEDLEVLSTLTFAVGMADNRESTLAAIVDQVALLWGGAGDVSLPRTG
jgi:hypothetical protein